MLDEGRQLVIVDHLVLDVEKWINEHPGGRFTLQKVVGSDISKFFFGGYALENNLFGVAPGYTHSYYAKRIANDLAIGVYEKDIAQGTHIVEQVRSMSDTVNNDTQTVVLATDKPTESFKSFYDDYRVIGKHFRVQWSGKIDLSRHYTICNVM